MYVIVVGGGSIGRQVIDLITHEHNDVVVIERDPERASELSQNYDCLVLHADATDKEVLEEAGGGDADAVITTTDMDATNVMVLLLARELGIPSLVSVVQNPEHMGLFRQIGANVLENPQRLIGEYLVRAVQRPSVKDFMSLAGTAEVFEITITQESALAGTTLAEAGNAGHIPEGVLIIAIQRNDEIITPRGDTIIDAGDLLTVFSKEGITDSLMQLFTGPK